MKFCKTVARLQVLSGRVRLSLRGRAPATALGLLLMALMPAAETRGALRDDALAALRQAGSFYHQNIAVHGGYVYYTDADDYTKRYAEGIPNMDQIFVQPPGTPAVGLAYLKAHEATGEAQFLNAAKDAANAMVYGQLKSGGWTQKIDFNKYGTWIARYRNNMYTGNPQNNSSLDDGQTQTAIKFMSKADKALNFGDPVIHEATEFALTALLNAQFASGGFPQVWTGPTAIHPVISANYPTPIAGEWPEGNYPGGSYWNFYTLNDGLAGTVFDTLRVVYEVTESPVHLNAIRKLGDFLILAQMPEPQPAWAQQYNFNMQPAWARKFEPRAIAGFESEDVIRTLMDIYRITGDAKYLAPLPRAIEYLKGNKLSDGRMARFYQLGTNLPLYMYREQVSGNWIYYLTYDDSNLPTHYGFKQPTEIDALEAEFLALQAGNPPPVPPPNVAELGQQVQQILADMDAQGRWVSTYDGEGMVGQPNFEIGFRFIDSAVFNRNMEILSEYVLATANLGITTPSPLPEGTVGAPYNHALAAVGGASPYTWSVLTGGLPSGLSLDGDGVIGGTPTAATTASFTVQVTDSVADTATMVYSLTIGGPVPPTITTMSPLQAGAVGVAYQNPLAAFGGAPPYVWSLDAGSLPSGLSLSGEGEISGTPEALANASFTVRVTGNDGLSSTQVFGLTVGILPTITTQPQSQTVAAGANASFTAVVEGSPTPACQWQKDLANIPGATSATLTLTNVQLADAATYVLVVTNAVGGATSNAAVLTVHTLPEFTQQPQGQTAVVGASVSFTAGAVGVPAPAYQWRKDSVNIPGATDATLTLSGVSLSDAGAYSVVATNLIGSIASNSATLTVNAYPVDQHFYNNGDAGATDDWNSATADRKWTDDAGGSYLGAYPSNTYHPNGYIIKAGRIGSPVGGNTSSGAAPTSFFAGQTLVVDGYNAASGLTSTTGTGHLIFELANPSATSAGSEAMPVGPRGTAQGVTATYGANAATKGDFIANIVTAATTGTEWRLIRGGQGVITLNGTLTLNGNTNFNLGSGPNDMLVRVNTPVTGTGNIQLSGGTAGGTFANGWLTWAFADLNGWRGTTLSVMHKHTVSFTGNTDFFTVNPAAALVFPSVSIGFLNLQADVSFASGKVTFSTGSSSNLVTNTVPNGVYTAAQLNAYVSTVTSSNPYLSLPLASGGSNFNTSDTTHRIYIGQALPPSAPVITAQPLSRSANAGSDVAFTVGASGTPAPAFQWKKNGVNISSLANASALTATLILPNVQPGDEGAYTVVVTNASGSVTSAGATLTVLLAPTITTADPLASGTVGTPYNRTLAASGGVPPYTWAIISGSLPTGLSLGGDGVISGTPLAAVATSFTVRVTGGNGLAAAQSFGLTIDPAVAAYDNWKSTHFSPAELANPAISGPEADPDADGLPNLLEYVFGNDPWVGAAQQRPSVQSLFDAVGGKNHLTASIPLSPDATDVTVIIEVSSDMAGWQSGLEFVETVSDTTAGGVRTLVVRDRTPLEGGTRRFIRIRVSRP